MKAASKPFKSKYDSGRCPICKRRISKDALIQRLDKTATWVEGKRTMPNGSGNFFTVLKTTDYVHAQCLEEYKEAKDEV